MVDIFSQLKQKQTAAPVAQPDGSVFEKLKQKQQTALSESPTGGKKIPSVFGAVGGFASDVFKSITKPAVTLGVRPFQAVKALAGATPEEQMIDLPYYGKIESPTTAKDVVKDVGRAVQTVTLGVPVTKATGVATTVAKAFGFGAKAAPAIGKVASGGALGYAFDVGSKLQQGKGAESFKPGMGTAIGAALPVAGLAMDAVSKSVRSGAPRLVNSLIKPLKRDLSYGKNPGRAVAEEGIVANNFDDLLEKITDRRQAIGQKIGQKLSSSSKKVDISNSFSSIDDAIQSARKAPRTNSALISRLESLKADILGETTDAAGNVVMTRKLANITPNQAMEVKQIIGDLTKFTGNHSDDAMANKALKQIYGKIKEKINRAVPGVSSLNEKYADLLSAQIATKYRNEIIQRQNLIGFGATTQGIGAALLTSIASGGAAIPSVLVGLSVGGLNKALSSVAVKTRVASLLAKQTPAQRTAFMQALESASPAIKDVLTKLIVQQTAVRSNLGAPEKTGHTQ